MAVNRLNHLTGIMVSVSSMFASNLRSGFAVQTTSVAVDLVAMSGAPGGKSARVGLVELQIIGLFLVMFFPQIALRLPELLNGGPL